jgi:hypothetical protein
MLGSDQRDFMSQLKLIVSESATGERPPVLHCSQLTFILRADPELLPRLFGSPDLEQVIGHSP